jgi:hypothetical protein
VAQELVLSSGGQTVMSGNTDHWWILHSIACPDCGAGQSFQLLDHRPTAEEVTYNEESLGGMFCIKTIELEVEMNGHQVINQYD